MDVKRAFFQVDVAQTICTYSNQILLLGIEGQDAAAICLHCRRSAFSYGVTDSPQAKSRIGNFVYLLKS
jgi:hypothetical protein